MMRGILWKLLVAAGAALAVRKLEQMLRKGDAPAWARWAHRAMAR